MKTESYKQKVTEFIYIYTENLLIVLGRINGVGFNDPCKMLV